MTPTRQGRVIAGLMAAITAVAIGADLLWVVPLEGRSGPPTFAWFGVLTGAFLVAQSSQVKLRLGAHAIGFSLMEFPLVIGLFFCSPQLLIASRVLGHGGQLRVASHAAAQDAVQLCPGRVWRPQARW